MAEHQEWSRLQEELARRVEQSDETAFFVPRSPGQRAPPGSVQLKYVGGLDTSFAEEESASAGPQRAVACLTILYLPTMTVVYQDFEPVDLHVPYVVGFLAFREVPAYKALLARVREPRPQVLLIDGFGVLHHRRCGSASHLGVETGYPTIGVGKHLLHIDGLEEWLVLRDLRAALARERGSAPPARPDPYAAPTPPPLAGPPAPATAFLDSSPNASAAMLPALSRGTSTASVPPGDAKRFHWQKVAEEEGGCSASASGAAESDLLAGSSVSGAIGESGPVCELPAQGGAGPLGRHNSGGVFEASRRSRQGSGAALDSLMPTGDETDTEEAGAVAARPEGARGAPGTYCLPGRDDAAVVCMDLCGADGPRLGVALAGVAGTHKPIYVSVGHKVSLNTAVSVVLACCKYRIPEPIRQADLRSRQHVRAEGAGAATGPVQQPAGDAHAGVAEADFSHLKIA